MKNYVMELLFTIGYYALIVFLLIGLISVLDTIIPALFKVLGITYLFRSLSSQFSKGIRLIAENSIQFNKIQYKNFKTLMILGNIILFLKRYV